MGAPFPHKYIRNTSARGAVLTEHLVNVGGTFSRFPKGKKSPFNCEGQNKEKREKGIQTGAMTGERFLALGSPVPGGEVSGDRGRALESQRARHLVYRGQRSEMLIHAGRWGPRIRLQRESWGEDWGWLCGQPKGTRMPCAPTKGIRE